MREVSVLKSEALGGARSFEVGVSATGEASPVSREQLRSRRKRSVRARTISVQRMAKRELEAGRLLYPADEHADVVRPKTRAECENGPRPCPFVSCEHHLYLDVSPKTGAIKLNFPDLEPDELAVSCVLDVAAKHGITLEQTAATMNLTRERIRQIEVRAMAKVKAVVEMTELRDHVPIGGKTKRRLPILADDEIDAERFASDELDDDGR